MSGQGRVGQWDCVPENQLNSVSHLPILVFTSPGSLSLPPPLSFCKSVLLSGSLSPHLCAPLSASLSSLSVPFPVSPPLVCPQFLRLSDRTDPATVYTWSPKSGLPPTWWCQCQMGAHPPDLAAGPAATPGWCGLPRAQVTEAQGCSSWPPHLPPHFPGMPIFLSAVSVWLLSHSLVSFCVSACSLLSLTTITLQSCVGPDCH